MISDPPSVAGKQEGRRYNLVDRWILERLDQVIADCRSAYEAFEFHKVYHTLNQFCAVDLSSLYIDITKDRMYCDAPDSPRRRATQAAMHEIFDALCRLLAPILAFTAEEAWGYSQPAVPFTCRNFPAAQDRPATADDNAQQVEELLRLRGVIGQAMEKARQEKLIGNALEAAVVLNSNSDVTAKIDKEELEEFFILSDLTIEQAKEPSASVSKTSYQKCARCWRHRADCRREQGASGFVRSLRKCNNTRRQSAKIDMKFIFFLSLPLYLLDQLTKTGRAPDHQIRTSRARSFPGFFDLVHITNTGAAFGSFKNNNTFFVALSCPRAALFVSSFCCAAIAPDTWRDVSLALLVAGVLGNLTDRLLYGHVIDFLLFDLHFPYAHPWPAFNVADSCICIAVVCFIIHSFRQKEEPARLEPCQRWRAPADLS